MVAWLPALCGAALLASCGATGAQRADDAAERASAARGGPGREAAAEPFVPVVLTSLERRLVDDWADGQLDEMSLLEAALIVSGVHDEGVLRQRVGQLLAKERAMAPSIAAARPAGELAMARAIFAGLWEHVLGRYERRASSVEGTIVDGTYNCVSATLLFNAICELHGIRTRAVETTSHVYALVVAEGRLVDVETTAESGFEDFAGRADEATYRRFLEERGLDGGLYRLEDGRAVPVEGALARRKASSRIIDNRRLLSIVYGNYAAVALDEGDSRRAMETYSRANALLPGETHFALGRDTLLHNMALAYLHDEDYGAAIRLLEFVADLRPGHRSAARGGGDEDGEREVRQGVRAMLVHAYTSMALAAAERLDVAETERWANAATARFPGDSIARHNALTAIQRVALRLSEREGRCPEAEGVLLRHMPPGPGGAVLVKTYVVLGIRCARAALDGGDPAGALAMIREVRREALRRPVERERLAALDHEEGLIHFARGHFQAAAGLLERAVAGGAGEVAERNLFAALANLVVEAFNRRDCRGALERGRRALELKPEDGRLLQMLAICERRAREGRP